MPSEWVDRVFAKVLSVKVTPSATRAFRAGSEASFWLDDWNGEMLIYDTHLSDSDCDDVESYLMTKWGIS